jgi:hypothetical protein
MTVVAGNRRVKTLLRTEEGAALRMRCPTGCPSHRRA